VPRCALFRLGMLVEKMDGPLKKLIRTLDIQQRGRVCLLVARGLAYLHLTVQGVDEAGNSVVLKKRILHRDLKADNVLCSNDLIQVKVSDFGLGRTYSTSAPGVSNRGTPLVRAPEVLSAEDEESSYGPQADVFSFAMLMYEILSGGYAWQREAAYNNNLKKIYAAVLAGTRPSDDYIWDSTDADVVKLVDIMKQCWKQLPDDRPTMHQVVAKLETVVHA
jgi:serine/threonine protein kinase